MKNSVPVVMAGIIAVSAYTLVEPKQWFKLAIQKIYGLVVSVLISGNRMYRRDGESLNVNFAPQSLPVCLCSRDSSNSARVFRLDSLALLLALLLVS